MNRTISVCPECDEPRIRSRDGTAPDERMGGPERYRCWSCPTTFEHPSRRAAKSDWGPPEGTLAKQLHDMDPDEVSG